MEILEMNTKIKNILGYILDNPNSDPNAFEMNDIMFQVSNILSKGKSEETKTLELNFQKMMYLRLPQLTSPERGLNATSLQEYFKLQLANISVGSDLGNDEMKKYLNSACGVNLYVHQRLREIKDEESIVYDNKEEHSRLFLERERVDDYGIGNEMMEEIDFALYASKPLYEHRKANFYKTR